MGTNFQTGKYPNHDLGGHDAAPFELPNGWTRLMDLLRSQLTLMLLAFMVTLALMLVFHQVVLGAMAQGELRQQTRDQQSKEFWRCNGLQVSDQRDQCLRQFNAAPGAQTSTQ